MPSVDDVDSVAYAESVYTTWSDLFDDSWGDFPRDLYTDPKSLFYRTHTVPKYYSRRDQYVFNRGLVVRGLDLRHVEGKFQRFIDGKMNKDNTTKRIRRFLARKTVAYPSRQRLINQDRFGMHDMSITYSMSKHKRWLLAEYFEKNAPGFQHPGEGISTVLATTECFFLGGLWEIPVLYPIIGRTHDQWHKNVKRLIVCNEDGSLCIRENRSSRGNSMTYLKPLTPAPNNAQTLIDAPNRKLSKRQRRRMEAECQEDPVRLTYFVVDPRVSRNHLDSTSWKRWNDGYERYGYEYKGINKRRRLFEHHNFHGDDESSIDLDFDDLHENEVEYSPRELMTLVDFIDDSRLLDLVFCGDHDFEILSCSDSLDADSLDGFIFVD